MPLCHCHGLPCHKQVLPMSRLRCCASLMSSASRPRSSHYAPEVVELHLLLIEFVPRSAAIGYNISTCHREHHFPKMTSRFHGIIIDSGFATSKKKYSRCWLLPRPDDAPASHADLPLHNRYPRRGESSTAQRY